MSYDFNCRLKARNVCYYSVQVLLSSRLPAKNLKIKMYKSVVFLVVLYDCETWSLTLRGDCKLRVCEKRLPRQIFGPKRSKNGDWRMLHSEELHNLYRSPYLVRMIKSIRLRWAGHVAGMEEGRSALKMLTCKPTGKRPLGEA